MSVFTHKKTEENTWNVLENDEVIINVQNKEDAEKLEEIFARMVNNFLQEKFLMQQEIEVTTKLIEFYQTLITKTLEDKLSDIDNMYAMKMMLKDIAKTMENLTPSIEQLKDEQKGEESD